MSLPDTKSPWNDTTATLAEIEAELGADHVAHIRSLPHPLARCATRAAGAWDANDPDLYRAYRSLECLLESQGVQS